MRGQGWVIRVLLTAAAFGNFPVRRDCLGTRDVTSMAACDTDRQCVGYRYRPDQSPAADGTAAEIQEDDSCRLAFFSPRTLWTLPAIRGRC